MRSSRAVTSIFMAVLLSAAGAAAQPVSPDEARSQARAIGEEGLSLYDQGMYVDALDRFEKADAMIHAPTLGLMAARSLEKLGRFVEASERYLQVTRIDIDAKASDVWKQSIVAATKEREALLPRIPSLEIIIEGAGSKGATVRIDGRPIPQAMVGVRSPIDPGVHRVDAKGTDGTVAFERIRVDEKQPAKLVLTLKQPEKGVTIDASAPGEDAGSTPPTNQGTGVAGQPSAPSAPAPNTMGLSTAADAKAGASVDQQRAAARLIGEEGLSFYDQGRYVDALDRFDRADDLIRAPTLGLMAARSLERLGRLVEATQRYTAVEEMKLESGASPAFKAAQSAAAQERETLKPRIPTIAVSVEGQGAAEVATIALDGRDISPSILGTGRPISATVPADPGDHRLEAKSKDGEAFERVTLAEKDTARVVLHLTPSPNKALMASGAPPKPPPAAPPPAAPPESRGKGQKTAAFVSIGVGAAGVAVGVITGSIAAAKQSDFSQLCTSDHVCPRSESDDVNTYNTLRPVSTVGFVVGGVGLGLGAVLLVTLPRGGAAYSTGSLQVTPFIGLGGAGLRGSF
jgi:tetratricopeptide (TPR) repeat protein